MSTLDELWEWIRDPLEELEKNFTEEPDKSWETRRGEFLQQLGVQEPGQHPVTEQMFKQLDEMSDDERRNQLNSKEFETVAYGLAQQHAASQETVGQGASQGTREGPGYDEQAWQKYLTTNATQWDGSEETWNQFTQWFLYYAGESGVQAPAAALIDYLGPLPADQRVTELARYGVTIAPPAPTGQPTGAEPNISNIMDEVLRANPQFAAISEERRIEIMNRALGKLQGGAGA